MRNSGLVTFNLNGDPFSDNELRYGLEGLAEHLEGYDKDSILDYIETMNETDELENDLSDSNNELEIAFEKIDKIQSIIDGIMVRNGISKTVAMEAMSVCEGLNLDIRKMSDQTTSIGLEFAMGEMTTQKKGLIALAIGVILAIIYKIVRYFTGGSSSDTGGGGGGVEKANEERVESSKKHKEVANSIIQPIKEVTDSQQTLMANSRIRESTQNISSDTEMDAADKEFITIVSMNSTDPGILLDKLYEAGHTKTQSFSSFLDKLNRADSVQTDILLNGEYTRFLLDIGARGGMFHELSNALTNLNASIGDVLTNVDKWIAKSNTAPFIGDIAEHTEKLNILNAGLEPVKKFLNELVTMPLAGPSKNGIIKPSVVYKFAVSTYATKEIAMASTSMGGIIENIINVVVKDLDSNIVKFQGVQLKYSDPNNAGTIGGFEPQLQSKINEAFKKISEAHTAYGTLMSNMQQFVTAYANTRAALGSIAEYNKIIIEVTAVLSKHNKDGKYNVIISTLKKHTQFTEEEFKDLNKVQSAIRGHSAELTQNTKVTDPLNPVGLLRSAWDIAAGRVKKYIQKVDDK